MNECDIENGGCQDVCNDIDGSFTCLCPNFIGFEAKGLICTGKGGSKIIICQSKEVRFDTVCRYR